MRENEKKENKIKELLKEYNLTIKDFAEITGAPARTVEGWSSGRSTLKEYEINTVISGLYAGEKITKDIYGYHISDVLLSGDTYLKIENGIETIIIT